MLVTFKTLPKIPYIPSITTFYLFNEISWHCIQLNVLIPQASAPPLFSKLCEKCRRSRAVQQQYNCISLGSHHIYRAAWAGLKSFMSMQYERDLIAIIRTFAYNIDSASISYRNTISCWNTALRSWSSNVSSLNPGVSISSVQ